MFCLLPAKCKQQQIALLIISFFLYVNGIRNEGSNMLQQQQQQQQPQLLHTTIENSNYQSSSSSSSANSIFKPSPLLEFTLDDATMPQHYKPTYEDVKYSNNMPAATMKETLTSMKEAPATNAETPNDNRRYSPIYPTNGGDDVEQQFAFPNDQQQQGAQFSQPHYQQEQHFAQQLTEMPIYIYKDPYTNENYHYTPTEPSNVNVAGTAAAPASLNDYNSNNGGFSFKQPPQYQTAGSLQDNQEYLVHSSMIVGTHPPRPSSYVSTDKDVYLKRPGLVYDESYIPHPNGLLEKKSESVGGSTKANKISYDSHDYPPPSYHQQQTSNFLPTPVPEIPPTPPPPVRRPPVYATSPPPPSRQPPSYVASRPPPQEYRPRPPLPPPQPTPTQQAAVYGHHQYLQSSQNALPNYANNLDNYLSNKQQTGYYRPERPPAYLQQQQHQQQQQQPFYETIPPPFRQQQQYQQSPYPPQRPQPPPQSPSYPQYENPQYNPPRPPPTGPSYNNYYDYQIGEIPPQAQGAFNYPYPRPPNGSYRPPNTPPTQQPSGLATLVQYAPQFTSLLLGGGGGGAGGGGSNSNSALGSLFGALTGGANTAQSSTSPSSSYNQRPVNSQLIKALENIARNDDLQCVPKVICQMIAAQTERGQLPSFITSPTITNFLSGFPASSPALIYGRAALLGISGGDKSCHQTYVKCPKNEYEIIYYLNNHRGGFFKFFSEPEPEQSFNQQNGNQDSSQSGGTSLFSILSALTGNEPTTTPRPRPKPKPQPQPASTDITGTIGNFFTQLLSDYMGGGATVEYQRRRRRSTAQDRVHFEDETKHDDDDETFNFQPTNNEDYQDDEEDNEDTQKTVEFVYEPEYEDDREESEDSSQARVVHKPSTNLKKPKFFPESETSKDDKELNKDNLTALIEEFNEFNKGRKLKFPSATEEREYVKADPLYHREAKDLYLSKDKPSLNYGHEYTNYQEGSYDKARDSKKVKFQEEDHSSLYNQEMSDLVTAASEHQGTKVKFPGREGKILNYPYYAASYTHNQLQQTEDKFVVSNSQRPQEYNESPAYDSNVSSLKREQDKLVLPHSQRPGHYYHQPSGSKDYQQSNQPEEYDYYDEFGQPQRPEDFNRYGHLQYPAVYNSQVTSLNSINNYVSNAATNNNYYGGFPLKQPPTSSNHFLPTPPPDSGDVNDYEYNNSPYPNNNFNNRYSSSNYHKTQSYTSANNNNYNRQTYSSSYRPLRNPSASNSVSSNSYNSANNQRYPSNSYSNSNSGINRYHSSLYTTRRTTTTPRPKNDNVYVTNSRGETEYYIRPDGKKVYLK